MAVIKSITLLSFVLALCDGFFVPTQRYQSGVKSLNVVPVELEGQLNPANKWDVSITFNGETKVITVPEDQNILEASEELFGDVPCSCRNGICTTCAAMVTGGEESLTLAVHGLSAEQREKGYTLCCQSYATGPGLKVELGKYDEVYEDQYGKYERNQQEEKKKFLGIF
eukprot:CAMPEP_0113933520 /NCGR_PEP_ID=MMETSP1339-20121228/548_1 /TAXON_ID=94617 /ORGANISM="Fibrocapsa japonica" /LENGTH=168 /DNA_ID=CAMNT_0000934805 /DNA_START=95 /DNA_END=601 /DNA_ORIENTATION=+ /assembly_acc=CAM_ASM_000762